MKFTLCLILLISLTIHQISAVRYLKIHKSKQAKTYSHTTRIKGKLSYKVQGIDDASKKQLEKFIKDYERYIGITNEEVQLVGDSLIEQEFVIFRPVNPGIRSDIQNKVAVGKGMNIHGKSSKLQAIAGMVPFSQKFSKTNDQAQIKDQDKSNQHSIDEGNTFKAKIAENKKCSEQFLKIYQTVVGKTTRTITDEKQVAEIQKHLLDNFKEKNTGKSIDIEVMGYYQFDKETCKPFQKDGKDVVKPVVADYDILILGNCDGMFQDNALAEKDFQAVYNLAKEKVTTAKFSKNDQLLKAVVTLNMDTNKDDIKNPFDSDNMGFAPAQSMKYIKNMISFTRDSGCVRHSAEQYNYVFIQKFTTEPHLFMQKNQDGTFKVDIIFLSWSQNPDLDITSIDQFNENNQQGFIKDIIEAGNKDDGELIQYALINYLEKMIQKKNCKCIPINLLWTQDAAKFKAAKWLGFHSTMKKFVDSQEKISPKNKGMCPLYSVTL